MIILRCGLLLLMMGLANCAVPLQSGRTEAEMEFSDGRIFRYMSTKDQAGIDTIIEEIDPETNKVVKKWKLVVEKSSTPEAAYMAMVQQQQALSKEREAVANAIKALASRIPPP